MIKEKDDSQLSEKRKFLFFLKLNASIVTPKHLKNRSLILKMRKEIARELGKLK
jgi:hypothetical protein